MSKSESKITGPIRLKSLDFLRLKLSGISAKFVNLIESNFNRQRRMEIASQSEASFDELNSVLGSTTDAYGWLSQKFYLPSLKSKAITKPYLLKMILSKSEVLKVPNTIARYYVEYRGITVNQQILVKLEEFLALNNLPTIGLNHLRLPDFAWIYNVRLWLDPHK